MLSMSAEEADSTASQPSLYLDPRFRQAKMEAGVYGQLDEQSP